MMMNKSDANKMKCCKNCKHRLGEKGDEEELKRLGYGIKIWSNCGELDKIANFHFDPGADVGTRIAFNDDSCCNYFEQKDLVEDEDVPTPIIYKDFSEPEPSPYEETTKEIEQVSKVEKEVPTPSVSTLNDDNDNDDDDIPF